MGSGASALELGCKIENTEERGITIPQLRQLMGVIEDRCLKEQWTRPAKDGSGTEHGLIVALTSQSISQAWSNITDQLAGATSMWDGLANSNAIVAQAGHTSSAAKLCLDYQAGGFTDWYLPSNAELNILWNNVFNVNKGLSVISGATPVFPTSICCTNYWSSSEGASSNAWNLYNYGYVNYSIKGTAGQVRAVRAF